MLQQHELGQIFALFLPRCPAAWDYGLVYDADLSRPGL